MPRVHTEIQHLWLPLLCGTIAINMLLMSQTTMHGLKPMTSLSAVRVKARSSCGVATQRDSIKGQIHHLKSNLYG